MAIFEDQTFTGDAKALGTEIAKQLANGAVSVEVLPVPATPNLTLRIWDAVHCEETKGH